MDCEGNDIQGIEKYETKKEKKPIYDKVMKILGLVEEDLDEDGTK